MNETVTTVDGYAKFKTEVNTPSVQIKVNDNRFNNSGQFTLGSVLQLRPYLVVQLSAYNNQSEVLYPNYTISNSRYSKVIPGNDSSQYLPKDAIAGGTIFQISASLQGYKTATKSVNTTNGRITEKFILVPGQDPMGPGAITGIAIGVAAVVALIVIIIVVYVKQ